MWKCGFGFVLVGFGFEFCLQGYGCGGSSYGFGCHVVFLGVGVIWVLGLPVWVCGWGGLCCVCGGWRAGCLRFDCGGYLGFVAILGILCFGFCGCFAVLWI